MVRREGVFVSCGLCVCMCTTECGLGGGGGLSGGGAVGGRWKRGGTLRKKVRRQRKMEVMTGRRNIEGKDAPTTS